MNWSLDDFSQSFRYGIMAVFIKHYPNGKSLCKRMRVKNNEYYLDDKIALSLPRIFNNGATILIPGDVVFISQDHVCSIIRNNGRTIFEVIGNTINKTTRLFKGESDDL